MLGSSLLSRPGTHQILNQNRSKAQISFVKSCEDSLFAGDRAGVHAVLDQLEKIDKFLPRQKPGTDGTFSVNLSAPWLVLLV